MCRYATAIWWVLAMLLEMKNGLVGSFHVVGNDNIFQHFVGHHRTAVSMAFGKAPLVDVLERSYTILDCLADPSNRLFFENL